MTTFKNACTALVVATTAFLGLAQVATASPVPANFEPGSVSFVSPSTGFLLGTSPCAHVPCTAVLTTTNGGKAWKRVAAPGRVVRLVGVSVPGLRQPARFCRRLGRLGVWQFAVGHLQRVHVVATGQPRWPGIFAQQFRPRGVRRSGELFPERGQMPGAGAAFGTLHRWLAYLANSAGRVRLWEYGADRS